MLGGPPARAFVRKGQKTTSRLRARGPSNRVLPPTYDTQDCVGELEFEHLRKPMMGAPTSDHQQNIELIRRMKSPNGYDPIPPAQYLYFLDDPDPVQRVLAWLRSKTIRLEHRQHYAVDSSGRALNIQDLANDCFNGDWTNANRALAATEARKLAARDQAGRLLLCGDVPRRDLRQTQENKADGKQRPVCTNWLEFCTNWSPPTYMREQVTQRSLSDRDKFAREYSTFLRWADDVEADAMAAARREIEAREKAFLEKRGIQKRNGKKHPPKRASSVHLTLLAEPDFPSFDVQTGDGQNNGIAVQVGGKTPYNTGNGDVQAENGGASLYTEVQRT